MERLAIIDAGHGGVRNGIYATAPNKQYTHKRGEFHLGSTFCEGVVNREIAARLEAKLTALRIPYITLYDKFADIPLRDRIRKANLWTARAERVCGVSIHANASPTHTARGSEVFTSPGQTLSDTLATLYYNYLQEFLPAKYATNFTMRTDFTDRDPDKEARLYVLTQSISPFMLIETLFFDQYDDARLLMEHEVQDLFADACAFAIQDFLSQTQQ